MFTRDLQHAVLRWGRRILTVCGLMPPAPDRSGVPMFCCLRGSWSLLDRSWGLLRWFGVALGGSWVGLGTSGGDFGISLLHIVIAHLHFICFWVIFIAYLCCVSLLLMFIAYLYCIFLLHICIAYLYCISILHISVAVLLSFVA